MRPSIRFFLGLLAVPFLASLAPAQIQFSARLDGASVVPATASPSVGRAWFHFETSTNRLWYRVETNVAAPIGGFVAAAPAGANGPALFPFAGPGPTFQGVSPVLAPGQVNDLFTRDLYVSVLSAFNPTGDVRGQIGKTVRRLLHSELDGAQAGNGGPATGTGHVKLLLPENVALYHMEATGLLAAPLGGADIHLGPPGVFGPVVANLNKLPGSPEWNGVTAPLNAVQVADMLAENTYFDVHTPAFFPAEIRGQLLLQNEDLVARGSGNQVFPPSGSLNTAFGEFSYDPGTRQLTYNVSWTGGATLGPPQLRIGPPNAAGAFLMILVGPPAGPWFGVSAPLPAGVDDDLFEARIHLDIASAAFPGGEVRGMVRANQDLFGYPGPTSAGPLGGVMRTEELGSPTLGNPSYSVTVFDAPPGASIGLASGPDRMGTPLDLGFIAMTETVLWVDPVFAALTTADATGRGIVTFAIPSTTALIGENIFFQWIAVDLPANPAGLVMSDAVVVVLE